MGSILTHDSRNSSPVPAPFRFVTIKHYLNQTKEDLVKRLLVVEQEYITCQSQLERLLFEVLDFKLQLEEASGHEPSRPFKRSANTV